MNQKIQIPNTKYFHFKSIIGEGQYAYVFQGYHEDLPNQEFAIKWIYSIQNENHVHYILRESQFLSQITISGQHENIVVLYDAFYVTNFHPEVNGCYLVMEYAHGGTVQTFLESCGVFDEGDAKLILYAVLDAVFFLHLNHIAHRDIKPANILFRDEFLTHKIKSNIILGDFGFCKQETEDVSLVSVVGSPGFMAPEIIFNENCEYTPICDIWSIGILAYCLFHAKIPFSFNKVNQKLYNTMISKNIKFGKNVSELGKQFIRDCLEVDPSKRPTAEMLMKHPWFSE